MENYLIRHVGKELVGNPIEEKIDGLFNPGKEGGGEGDSSPIFHDFLLQHIKLFSLTPRFFAPGVRKIRFSSISRFLLGEGGGWVRVGFRKYSFFHPNWFHLRLRKTHCFSPIRTDFRKFGVKKKFFLIQLFYSFTGINVFSTVGLNHYWPMIRFEPLTSKRCCSLSGQVVDINFVHCKTYSVVKLNPLKKISLLKPVFHKKSVSFAVLHDRNKDFFYFMSHIS